MTDKLKPCPFCNGEAEFVLEGCVVGRIRCKECHVTQCKLQPIGRAIEDWNKREKFVGDAECS